MENISNKYSFPGIIRKENKLIIGDSRKSNLRNKIFETLTAVLVSTSLYFTIMHFGIFKNESTFILSILIPATFLYIVLNFISHSEIVIDKDKSIVIFKRRLFTKKNTTLNIQEIAHISINCIYTGEGEKYSNYNYQLDFIDNNLSAYSIYSGSVYRFLYELGKIIADEMKIKLEDNSENVNAKFCLKRIV